MGRDKALVVVDGNPLVRRVVLAARQAGAAPVVTVGGDTARIASALAGLDVTTRADDHPGEGPLGALVTALGVLDAEVVLVLGCDLLDPSAAAMAATVAALLAEPTGDVAVPVADGRAQWLHAAWRRRGRDRLRAVFATGERAVHRAVAAADLAVVPVTGLDPSVIDDADTPADLARRPGPERPGPSGPAPGG